MLLEDKELNGIPLLVIGNKIDIKPHLTESEIITGNKFETCVFLTYYNCLGLNLDYITTNVWAVMMVSALKGTNIQDVVDWLVKKSK